MQFTKLFSSILDSTIWQEPPPTKLVWITMLAMADRTGEVHTSIPGLARRAGVTIPECEGALDCLKSPDSYSRTKDHDGRRVTEIDGGFRLLNHGKYRALLSAEERREYNRTKQAEYRSIKKAVNDMSMTVNDNVSNAHSTEAEAEAEAPSTSVEGVAGGTAIAAPASAVKKTRKAEPITDEYLIELQSKYTWANVRQEFTKASTWCESKNKTCSRMFFVNWLNRVSPPPSAKGFSNTKGMRIVL